MIHEIKALAKEIHADVIAFRRHMHANPELSYQEHETMAYVASILSSWGIPVTKGVAETGLTALIEGQNPSKRVIGLRADMDALPILEANDVPYKSKVDGVMHACGHDVHSASLLGAAKILWTIRDQFEGTIKLVFQPGEEKNPGGASLMIKDGVLENPSPQAMFAQHVMPLIEVGKVGFRSGMYMASADEIYLTIKGKGGHAAVPELNVDTVLIASHIIVAMQQVISRNCNPKMPSVLSFGKVEAKGATNIIPNEVKIAGTFRALDEEWRSKAHGIIKRIAEGTAEAMGGTCEVHIDLGYPFLYNDPALVDKSRNLAEQYLGKENVEDLPLWMGAEDFAYFTHERPSCFYRLGTGNVAKGINSYVHTPTFDIDEDALEIGAGLMAWLAYNEVQEQ